MGKPIFTLSSYDSLRYSNFRLPSISFYMSSFHPLRVQFLFTVARFLCRPPGPEFRENSRERGRRSPENRSQRLRPPLGGTRFTTAKRQSRAGRKPQRGRNSGRRRVLRADFGGARGAFGRKTGGITGKVRARSGKNRAAGAKAGEFSGKRRTAGAFRAAAGRSAGRSAGRKPGKPGGCGAETAASGGVLPGKQRGSGAKTAGFRGCGRQKGAKRAPRRRGSGGKRGGARHIPDGV